MKNPRRTIIILSIALAVSIIAGIGAFAASNYGTSSDPLITLSYLNNTLKPDIMKQVDSEVAQKVLELEKKLDSISSSGGVTAQTFQSVTLSLGQTLTGETGCEIMLRSGVGLCSASGSSVLADLSDGDDLLSGGSLAQNHLYLALENGSGVTASSDKVTLLVRGGYSVG